jgi:hypothetical protein
MRKFDLVIAGGCLTAARAIKSYRGAGGGGHGVVVEQTPAPTLRDNLLATS